MTPSLHARYDALHAKAASESEWELANGELLITLKKVLQPSRLVTSEYRLFFVCPVTMTLAPTNGGDGFELHCLSRSCQ